MYSARLNVQYTQEPTNQASTQNEKNRSVVLLFCFRFDSQDAIVHVPLRDEY